MRLSWQIIWGFPGEDDGWYAEMAALIAPLVLWPQATGGQMDPARMSAAAAAIVAGVATRNTLAAIFGGAAVLALGLWLGA